MGRSVQKTKNDVNRCEVATFARGATVVLGIYVSGLLSYQYCCLVLWSFGRWRYLYVHSRGVPFLTLQHCKLFFVVFNLFPIQNPMFYSQVPLYDRRSVQLQLYFLLFLDFPTSVAVVSNLQKHNFPGTGLSLSSALKTHHRNLNKQFTTYDCLCRL